METAQKRKYPWFWSVWPWIGLGLVFSILNRSDSTGPVSPYWYLEWVLFGLMVAGLCAEKLLGLKTRLPVSRRLASFAYVSLVWLFGMMYEASLTVTGEGIGGIHQQTVPSFILAQGDYIPIAIVSLLVIRATKASFREAFFFAGGKSLTEGLVFTGVLTATVLSPMFFLSPLVLAYHTLVYASIIALPLLFVDARLLWAEAADGQRRGIPFYWLTGFVLAFAIRLFWGLVYGPAATLILDLPPNSQ